ncbi:MAG: GNAT family N-acetyltransferase [Ruminococcaceae bacterium]|nr:GNAT family N-acetyltransferase [Oscillospiraceae bacterium]
MIFRKATIDDADAVSKIYDLARESLKRNGIPQWQEGVPGRSTFLQDVNDGVSYVIDEQGEVIATVQIIDNEPYYDNVVDGYWTVENALVAHRVAVLADCRQNGIGSRLLEEAENIALAKGKHALRLDTHEKNFKMRGMLEKNGYKNIGKVYMPNGEERFAYEKILN